MKMSHTDIPVSNPKKCHFLHFFGHIEIHRNLKTSRRPCKLKQSNKVSFLGPTLKTNQIASVGVSMFFYVTKKTSKIQKKVVVRGNMYIDTVQIIERLPTQNEQY